jgi:hypothetical protein
MLTHHGSTIFLSENPDWNFVICEALENHRWKSGVKPVVARGTEEEEDPLRGPRGMEGGLLTAVRLKRGRLWVGDGGD